MRIADLQQQSSPKYYAMIIRGRESYSMNVKVTMQLGVPTVRPPSFDKNVTQPLSTIIQT